MLLLGRWLVLVLGLVLGLGLVHVLVLVLGLSLHWLLLAFTLLLLFCSDIFCFHFH